MRADRPSKTAAQVAQVVTYLEHDPDVADLVPSTIYRHNRRLLETAGLWKPFYDRLSRSGLYRRFIRGVEHCVGVDSQVLNIGLRKRFLDDETRAAFAEGASQFLVVGGGFDTLPWRLAKDHPTASIVETDHPSTQEVKRAAFDRLGVPGNLHLVAADLGRRSLGQVVGELGEVWSPEVKSVFVAEGVLMYLELEVVESFFDAVHELGGPGSRLLFTHMRLGADGEIHTGLLGRLARANLRRIGEALHWAVAADAELEALLARHGWRLDPAERRDLHARYVAPSAHAHRGLGGIEFAAAATRL